MGVLSRMSTVFKAKVNKMLDRAENPEETLDYSYQKQLELLQQVKRGVVEVVGQKKRLELQAVRLREQNQRLEQQAKDALKLGKEDLAVEALRRKQQAELQLQDLETQIKSLESEQEKLERNEQRLRSKVESFRTQKELIKAQYSAASAQVKIGEAATGLSEELADVNMAVERAQRKTQDMQSRAAAIDELVEKGTLQESWGAADPLEEELRRAKLDQGVSSELERLKREVAGQ
ncbi:PspA/IM30 family protein [Limnochorda pilosa]|uniref:Phage-shock protein n=1 Tax=Limnochorda pilosa TaxID=1555112 RepID=A0A0K2SN72_LIMPI|nr:PspA/IM30 family protein [Limnochorda pilosa]BAS28560.1 phage-shock protein [Limnochorda pilosa]